MATYQVLACHGGETSRDASLSVLKSNAGSYCDETATFDVPDGLKFGTFDSLIKLMDDLSKTDGNVEGVLRRIERQMTDIGNPEFQILVRQKTVSVEAYIRSFMWDDTKFPRNRYLADNLSALTTTVTRIDDDVKAKTFQYQDVKSSLANMSKLKGPGTSLTSVDLVDILTPGVVQDGDFVTKEHLHTVLVIVPRGGDKDFLANYEKIDPYVVPRSAKQFKKVVNGSLSPIDDKDGNTLWRVICFKNAVETLRKGLRECKCSLREFSYDPMAAKNQAAEMDKTDLEVKKKESDLKRLLGCAFSDVFVAWMHLKAIRCFVESVLRYGVPANFHAFVVRVPLAKNIKPLKSVLSDKVFKDSTLFGQSYIASDKAGAEGEEEYNPYVCLPFTAFQPLASS